jgi:hypothetical protein
MTSPMDASIGIIKFKNTFICNNVNIHFNFIDYKSSFNAVLAWRTLANQEVILRTGPLAKLIEAM